MLPDTCIPDEQLVPVYMSTDTSSKQCSIRGYMSIHVAVTTVLSPIQDTCRRRQGIQVDTTCIRATCITCKRGVRHSWHAPTQRDGQVVLTLVASWSERDDLLRSRDDILGDATDLDQRTTTFVGRLLTKLLRILHNYIIEMLNIS